MTSRPVAIISYNRPDLLRTFLASLKDQSNPVDPGRVALFQDHGDPACAACVDVFRELFPEGEVFVAEANLGVALNIDSAERHVFEKLGADVAYFFEDDLILGREYLAALDQLAEFALAEERVGYFAAYGSHRATAEEQVDRARDVVLMDHKWGFGLTRRQWERQKPIIDPYLDIVRQRPYRQRDEAAIKAYYGQLGYTNAGTSQDGAKDVAGAALGTAKIMSFACFAHYEGREGLHMRPELFDELGYDKTQVYAGTPDFVMPSGEQLDQWIEHLRASLRTQDRPSEPPAAPPVSRGPVFGRWSPEDIGSAPHMEEEGSALLQDHLHKCICLLEYGAGGSSVMAARLGVPTVISVESDEDFLSATRVAVEAVGNDTRFLRHFADIGPTGEWGTPKDQSRVKQWPRYSSSIWGRIIREELPQPDLVLIDGRFRVACMLATLMMARPGTRVLFDDYFDRPHYHMVEKHVAPTRQAGRMAEFIVPDALPDRTIVADLLAMSTDFA